MASLCGLPVFAQIYLRLQRMGLFERVVVATSKNPGDDVIADFSSRNGLDCFRGDPENVLNRIRCAGDYAGAEFVVEVGGDCPFVDRDLMVTGLAEADRSGADLVTNALLPPFTYPVGYDFIGIRMEALREADRLVSRNSQKRQPFQFFLKNPGLFKLHSFQRKTNLSSWRWTLDYEEDLDMVRAVFEALFEKNPDFTFTDLEDLFRRKPELLEINKRWVDPPSEHVAWHTGSYHLELLLDIKELLEEAAKLEHSGGYERLCGLYAEGSSIFGELERRAKYFRGRH